MIRAFLFSGNNEKGRENTRRGDSTDCIFLIDTV